MDQTLTDRFRRWFDYEMDSHAKTLASLQAVPDALRSAPEYQKAVSLMAHIVLARQLWLFRLGAYREAPGPNDFFPEGVTLPDLEARLELTEGAWLAFLGALDDAAISRT